MYDCDASIAVRAFDLSPLIHPEYMAESSCRGHSSPRTGVGSNPSFMDIISATYGHPYPGSTDASPSYRGRKYGSALNDSM